MLTATMPAHVRVSKRAHVDRFPTPAPADEYPLFGTRVQVLKFVIPNFADAILQWLMAEPDLLQDHPQQRWKQCQWKLRAQFTSVWMVDLPERSRQLGPGRYVFKTVPDFVNIPGRPPAAVPGCYQQALADLPRHCFVYLDLMWEQGREGRRPMTPETIEAMAKTEADHFLGLARRTATVIAQSRRRVLVLRRLAKSQARKQGWRAGSFAFNMPAAPKTLAEAQRLLGLTVEDYIRQYMIVLDPVIVALDPKFLINSVESAPLKLIAHWD